MNKVKQTATKQPPTAPCDPLALMVRPLDMAKLNEDINLSIHKERPFDPTTYRTHDKWAICDTRLSLVDDECIYYAVDGEDDKSITLNIYGESIVDGKGFISCFPAFTSTQDIAHLRSYMLDPIPLAKFMAGRFDYNSRIKNNTHHYCAWVGSGE
jgi:hypothetical protein